jgi:site-specific recombinase XerD
LGPRRKGELGKRSKRRTAPLDDACQGHIAGLLEDKENRPNHCDIAFISIAAYLLTPTKVGSVVREAGRKLGLKREVRSYLLRHTRIIELLGIM